ncbi:hypothetical protein TL16_g06640 [Triparma laevis f. inornata]|uniref:J domain-containing protein n=1 Tax=Triparma laevis f. inornata TaxID=1714386 RepID=A0A9W7AMQ4_9STRA|nr:hypothetical protein TL16_g06640 [Triparma laevis f. inornata]
MPLPKWNPQIDYYSLLNLSPICTPTEIKTSFTSLALTHHPDLNPTSCPKKFQSIVEAKEILSNPDIRRMYDNERNNGWSNMRREKFKGTNWKDGFDPNDRRRR